VARNKRRHVNFVYFSGLTPQILGLFTEHIRFLVFSVFRFLVLLSVW